MLVVRELAGLVEAPLQLWRLICQSVSPQLRATAGAEPAPEPPLLAKK